MSDGSHLVAHGIGGEILLSGILHTGNGSVAEAVIREGRTPRLSVFLAIADINILREGITEVVEIQTAVSLQFLGIFHTDGITLLATDLETNPARHVLSEIYDEGIVAMLQTHRMTEFLLNHSRHRLRHQRTVRNGTALGFLPLAIVETSLGPALQRLFPAGIILLAIILVVAADRTIETQLPCVVGSPGFGLSVLILHLHVDAAFRITEERCLVCLLQSHRKHSAVAQFDGDGILLGQERSDIKGIVIDGLAIIGWCRLQCLTAPHTLTVDIKLVYTESGNISHRPLHLAFCRKVLADIACRQSGVHAFLFSGLQVFQANPGTAPFGFTEQSDGEELRFGPFRFSFIGSDTHLPVSLSATQQRLALIRNPQLFIAVAFTAIP